ncbi:subtilase family protein [Actinocorallia herbida]|uniref:Subtilase family protein n=1 Tax=Actinocorallia herbida TaxID=58109 RepID=A0A3N1CX51_9ACTN|nr:S8 family peptidase [Actinocorallia herbida]ROO85844.1 subtilase family protein [Actinocorallia herbida]
MRKPRFVLPVLALALIAATAGPASAEPAPRIEVRHAPAEAARTGEYLVALADGASPDSVLARARVTRTTSRWSAALNGFAAPLSARQLDRLRRDARVLHIVEDAVVSGMSGASSAGVQPNPGWALDRIDQAVLPLDGSFTTASTGAGVNAYVIDTGIDTAHPDFGGRASVAYDNVGDGYNGQDCDGHGTRVAGALGGAQYGVAKAVNLFSVRFSDCNDDFTLGQYTGALDWVAAHHQKPAVANISTNWSPAMAYLMGSYLRLVANGLADSGVFVTASAGNDNIDACQAPPADAAGAFAVAASDATDARASFSNWGSCVDLYAPGVAVDLPTIGGGHAAASGTSFAAPLAAGVAALYKATYGDTSYSTIRTWLLAHATSGVISGNTSPTPNLLLSTGGL